VEDIRYPSYALGANCLEDVFLLLLLLLLPWLRSSRMLLGIVAVLDVIREGNLDY
jgi:hypothetical protein